MNIEKHKDFLTSACQGGTALTDRMLGAYATRTGSTTEVTGLDDYSGAFLGSAVRHRTWLAAMTAFMSENRQAPSATLVAYFIMHMLAFGDDAAAVAEPANYTAKARDLVTPAIEALFEGMIDTARLSFVDRLAIRLMKLPVGDKCDCHRIGAWADALAPRSMMAQA